MKPMLFAACFFLAVSARSQIQVDLKLPRLQYIAYEPVVAKLTITNLAGRSIDLRDSEGQTWFGFEITGSEGQPIAPVTLNKSEVPLNIPAGKTVTQKINLTPLYAVHDFGAYRVRAPNHTALYVRVEDKSTGDVYATYSLGRIIGFEEPQAELDRANQLHILHCTAPRNWIYSRVGLNGELLAHSAFTESKTRPRLRHASDGAVIVFGGTIEASVAESARTAIPKLSARPPEMPKDD
jgi:hypothetical protein